MPRFDWTECAFSTTSLVESTLHAYSMQPAYTIDILFENDIYARVAL
jgi:hypothetical protein